MTIEIKTREFNFYQAPCAEFPGYVAYVGHRQVGHFHSALDAAKAAAEADFAENGGERGQAFVSFVGEDRPAGAMKPGRLIRVCYRVRKDRYAQSEHKR